MKKILFALCVLMASVAFGQGVRLRTNLVGFAAAEFAYIPGYTKLNVRYEFVAMAIDSGFHVPQYNGVPSGVRSGVWQADGAIAADTLNGYFYQYWNGAWVKYAKYSDLTGAQTWQQTLTTGSTLTGNNTIAGGGNNFTWNNAGNITFNHPGGYFDIQSVSGSDSAQLLTSLVEISGYTSNGSTDAAFKINQDIYEGYVKQNNDFASVRADYISSDLAAGIIIHPTTNINYGVNVSRLFKGVQIGRGITTNSNNFRGIRVDSLWQVYLDSIDAGPGVYNVRIAADGKLTYADTASGGGITGVTTFGSTPRICLGLF